MAKLFPLRVVMYRKLKLIRLMSVNFKNWYLLILYTYALNFPSGGTLPSCTEVKATSTLGTINKVKFPGEAPDSALDVFSVLSFIIRVCRNFLAGREQGEGGVTLILTSDESSNLWETVATLSFVNPGHLQSPLDTCPTSHEAHRVPSIPPQKKKRRIRKFPWKCKFGLY